MLNRKKIEDAVKTCLVKAGTTFRKDQLRAYRRAIQQEPNPNARWVLERILENAETARKKSYPLCDDTGIPHVFVEVGEEVRLPKGWAQAIHRGIARGLQDMPGRPMAIKGNAIERIEQSKGLFKSPDKVLPGPVILKTMPGDKLAITVLLLGGGPEIRAKTFRIFHQRSADHLLVEAISWITSEINSLGCTPCVAAMGIGRSHAEAAALMLESMKEGSLNRQSLLEKKATDLINSAKIGPLGLGGKTTALGSFIKVGPQRASGVRIVSVRPCCCFEPRRSTVVLSDRGNGMDRR